MADEYKVSARVPDASSVGERAVEDQGGDCRDDVAGISVALDQKAEDILMDYSDKVSEFLQNAAEQACKLLEPALTTLTDLIGDKTQTGAVRVSASKLIIDVALKLDTRAIALDRQEQHLATLGDYLQSFERAALSDSSDEDEDDEE